MAVKKPAAKTVKEAAAPAAKKAPAARATAATKTAAAKPAAAKPAAAKRAPAAAAKPAVVKPIAERQNKTQILNQIVESTELSRKQVQSVLDELSNIIEGHIKKKGVGEFVLPGLSLIHI